MDSNARALSDSGAGPRKVGAEMCDVLRRHRTEPICLLGQYALWFGNLMKFLVNPYTESRTGGLVVRECPV